MLRDTPGSPRRLSYTVTLGVAAIVLLGMVGVSYHEWRQYSRANADAARTREIHDSVDALLFSLIDAETGQRGFLLTGEDRYLEPYNRAIQEIPGELAHLKGLLATRPDESENVARLESLVDQKLTELRQTIDLRRTNGVQQALSLVLSSHDKRVMDEIRALGSEIHGRESSTEGQASAGEKAAAGATLLATIAGSLVLFFLFAFRLDPFASPQPQAWRRSWPLRYGAAVLAVVAITLLRAALTPLIGRTNLPFTLFFCAVAFAAWFGGFRPAVLSIALSLLAGSYFFAEPAGSFRVNGRDDQVAMLMIIVVGFGMALLSRAQRSAVDHAMSAENSERNLRQRFETTLASIGDAVIVTDAAGRVTFANKIALSLMRRTESEIAGKSLDEAFRIINELTRVPVESPAARVLREGGIVGLANHTVLIASDGTEVPIDDSAAPIRAADGSVQGTVMVFRDVTARRRAEATSRLLASIVESSDDAITSVDLNGVVTSWNKGAERTFGYLAGEMIGRPISSLAAPETADDFPRILEEIKKGERTEYYETVRRTKRGELINVLVTASPVRDATERIVGVSRITRDITERVRAAERVAQLNADLQNTVQSLALANRDLERFAFVASHDLQEPLRMITAYAQLLVKNYPAQGDQEATTFVGNIVDGTRRMRELLGDLLAYSEIGARLEDPPEAVDLNQVMESVRQNLKASIDENRALVISDRLPTVRGHQSHFIQLFQNLIGNALKYKGDDPPRIQVTVQEADSHLRFAVSDNGIGIAPEDREKIFEVFRRLHGKDVAGTGIGLAICQRVVERYAGRIWVESQVGQGSMFVFTLPKTLPLAAQASQGVERLARLRVQGQPGQN
ncbi:MAG TPA: PAS domain S-box protein [Terriglobia bacterium]|nr:PAS domain S-box protein [Terriglobia bacterium]